MKDVSRYSDGIEILPLPMEYNAARMVPRAYAVHSICEIKIGKVMMG